MSQPWLNQRIPLNIPWLSYKRSTAPAQFAKAPAAEPENACLSEIDAACLPRAHRGCWNLTTLCAITKVMECWSSQGLESHSLIGVNCTSWAAFGRGNAACKDPDFPGALWGTEPRGFEWRRYLRWGKMHLKCWLLNGTGHQRFCLLHPSCEARSYFFSKKSRRMQQHTSYFPPPNVCGA